MSGVLNGPIPFIFEEIKPRALCPEFSFTGVHLHSQRGQETETLDPAPVEGICLLAVTLSTKRSLGLRIWRQQQNTFSNTKNRG